MEKTIEFDEFILERILDIGCGLLKAGGEIRRVENTISTLCAAYGAKQNDVFTITSSMVVTVRFEDKPPMTQTRRITHQAFNMREFEFYNGLSRKICATLLTNEEILRELEHKPTASPRHLLLTCVWALISACFTLFFGGGALDALISLFIGALLYISYNLIGKFISNHYCTVLICSIIGGILANTAAFFLDGTDPFFVNIGNIMLLIPGVALTTAVRDMLSGDTISGILRFFESLIISLAIAWGFAVINATYTLGRINDSAVLQLLTAAVGSFGFSVIFKCRIKRGIIGGCIGMLGWGIVLIFAYFGLSEYTAFFVASIAITLLSRLFAKLCKCPATPFLLVASIPLVPGKALYLTMAYAFKMNFNLFLHQAMSTIIYAICISCGMIVALLLLDHKQIYAKNKNDIKNNK